MFTKRTRFLSDQSISRSLSSEADQQLPLTPVISTLDLDFNEELEDLEIPPSEEFESQRAELSVYLSTDDEANVYSNVPKLVQDAHFNLGVGGKNKPKRRAYSTALNHSKLFIIDALVFNKRSC